MAINDLYAKVSSFEDSISQESKTLSQCRKGCAKCCYVDLSVFTLEANAIRKWFATLNETLKSQIRSSWKKEEEGKCVFLIDEACTIYEARPLICRTQGLPLSFRDAQQVFLDICPLNEDMLNVVRQHEILNLDLLNSILSALEKKDAGGNSRERVSLRDLRNELSS